MDNAASILTSVFKSLGMEERLVLARLQKDWPTLFDEPLSCHIYPASLNNGILIIKVDSPLWMQQLKYFKKNILEKLSPYRIKNIDLRHGRTVERSQTTRVSPAGRAGKILSEEDITWIEQTLSAIDDPELKEEIRKVLEKKLRAERPELRA